MRTQAEIFDFYKRRLLAQARSSKGVTQFFDGTIPPTTGWTRYCVIEYVCSFPKLDPIAMAATLTKEGIKIYFDDSSISKAENMKKERAVDGFSLV